MGEWVNLCNTKETKFGIASFYKTKIFLMLQSETNEIKYSRMDQVKFVGDSSKSRGVLKAEVYSEPSQTYKMELLV